MQQLQINLNNSELRADITALGLAYVRHPERLQGRSISRSSARNTRWNSRVPRAAVIDPQT
jgi:hypothetical protein